MSLEPVRIQVAYLFFSSSVFPASEFSHSILATAISHVSRTTSASSFVSLSRFSMSRLPKSPSAPSASAASCLHIESSSTLSNTARRNSAASGFRVCPRQYASSCFSSAEGEVKAAAMAWMAGMEAWQARCLRENRARKRRARGSDSDVRVFRRAVMTASWDAEVSVDSISQSVESSILRGGL